MSALGEQNVNSFLFANDPHALVLFVLFTDIVERALRRRAGIERCRRQEKNARKSGAQETREAEKRKYSHAAPTETREKISSAQKASSFRCQHESNRLTALFSSSLVVPQVPRHESRFSNFARVYEF